MEGECFETSFDRRVVWSLYSWSKERSGGSVFIGEGFIGPLHKSGSFY